MNEEQENRVTASPRSVIHVICPEVGDSIGGADLHVLDLAEAQQNLGMRVEVASIGAPEHFMAFAEERKVNVRTIRIRTARRQLRESLAVMRGVPVVVHSHGYEADYLTAAARSTWGPWRDVAWIATCHGLIAPDLRHQLLNVFGRLCLRQADRVVVVSDVTNLGGQLNRDVAYIQNGVRHFQPVDAVERERIRKEFGAPSPEAPDHDDAVLVGYIGRFSREKRPDLFLDMADRVAARYSQVRFVMAGGGPLHQEIAARARQSRAAKVLHLTGCRRDVQRVFAALDVLVLPSDTEGTSRVVLEANQIGLPVVATAVGAVPRLIEDGVNGLLTEPGDVHSLTAAIEALVDDQQLRMSLSHTSAEALRRGTAEQMAIDTVLVYDAVLESPTVHR
ncbi:MAG: glycosyltransferase [Streptosporangiales bacterium]|nr:glycosyltransferase [Streptosporangiales bacterium]